MGEETAAVREVDERPGAVTHGAAIGEGSTQRHGDLLSSARLGKLAASFISLNMDSLSARFCD